MVIPTINVFEGWCGVGGLGLGLKLAYDGRAQVVGCLERQSHKASTLVARMSDKTLDDAPIWDDAESFNGERWRGCVDVFCAGIPCQPFSYNGNRKAINAERGIADERWQWPHAKRIIEEMSTPQDKPVVFIENVPALEDNEAFGIIVDDLQGLGYRTASIVVDAFAVGASHGRARLFLLADPDVDGHASLTQRHMRPDPWGGVDAPRWVDSARCALFPPRAGRHGDWAKWPAARQPWILGGATGTSAGMDASDRVQRIGACGDSVVPLVAGYAFCNLWAALVDERLCPSDEWFDRADLRVA